MGQHRNHASGGMQSISAKDGQAAPAYMIDGAQGGVRLRYFAPPEGLRAYFGALYVFTQTSERYSDVTRADVPQLRFMLSGTGRYHFQDGTIATTPDICLVGPTFGATRFELDSPALVVGISLLPAGWVSLGGGDASATADRVIDISDLREGAFVEMLDRLRGLDDAEAMVECCWSYLSRWLQPLPESTWRLLEAVDGWLMGEGSPRIEMLVEKTGLSPRQLARLTNRYYGCPPKLLARKYRALRCSARIALDHHSWQELCEDGRFYDQSHFIREIKHFIGLTPHQLQVEPTAVAQLTLLRRSLGGDVAVLNRFS